MHPLAAAMLKEMERKDVSVPEVPSTDFDDDDDDDDDTIDDEEPFNIPSFATDTYASPEMHALINLNIADEKIPDGVNDMRDVIYRDSHVFPSWMLNSSAWSKNKIVQTGNVISDILKIPPNIRAPEEVSKCIHWLMSRWKIAETMVYTLCTL